jgi:hypothetical protein
VASLPFRCSTNLASWMSRGLADVTRPSLRTEVALHAKLFCRSPHPLVAAPNAPQYCVRSRKPTDEIGQPIVLLRPDN